MFIAPAYAQATAVGPSIFDMLLPLIFVVFIVYFMVIRPQQKQRQTHDAMLAAMRRGDQIVTQGGLMGRVAKVNDDHIEVEIAKDTRVKIVKSMVVSVQGKGDKKDK